MRWLAVLGFAAVAACGFHSPPGGDSPDGAPPPDTQVRFVSVTSEQPMLQPGLYGFEVTAVLRNELDVAITGIRASLTFHEGSADRAGNFRWRDADARDGVMAPQPASIPAGQQATFRFRVDALASAVGPGPILVNGEATFQAAGSARSASPLDPPTSLPVAALPAPIVVSRVVDEDNTDTSYSLREAIKKANANPGLDRIVFDPAVFPPGSPVTITLAPGLGEIPPVAGDLVIDAGGAGVVVTVSAAWAGTARYGLRLASGTLVVHGLTFRDLGLGYPVEDVSTNNCGLGGQLDGGAIRVDGGTLILDGNRFADPGVTERNCYAASIRLQGGTGHRILDNTWTETAMDAVNIKVPTREVSGNVMDGSASFDKADDGIVIDSLGGSDLWVVGNVFVDQEYSGILTGSVDTGTLYVVNNTFVRQHRGSGVFRSGGRHVELHNNAYHSNQPAAIGTDAVDGNLRISHEAEFGNGAFCTNCGSAMIQMSTISSGADLGFTRTIGTTPADFLPLAGSVLVDSGMDLVDRNGSAPGRFDGAGPERGAVELP